MEPETMTTYTPKKGTRLYCAICDELTVHGRLEGDIVCVNYKDHSGMMED